MGERLPCKQEVRGSNPLVSRMNVIFIYCTLKTAYPKIREGCKDEETDSKLACKTVSKDLYQRDTSEMKRSEIEPESLADRADGKDI